MIDLPRLLGWHYPYLADNRVVEISLNPDGAVFVEYFGQPPKACGTMPPAFAERFIRNCASASNAVIARSSPIWSGRIPGTAHRIEALLPPLADGPAFSIRRHREQIVPLAEFAPDTALKDEIEAAIAARKNIVLAGSTGSGKTTLANSCLAYLCDCAPDTRVLILEDTPEIQTGLANCAQFRTAEDVSLDRLLASSLRFAPTRIVLGEVRTGPVLMTLLKAWNTGHPGGITTIHANSAGDVLNRMRILCGEVSPTDQSDFILSALDMVLFVARGTECPRITQIARRTETPGQPPSLETTHV